MKEKDPKTWWKEVKRLSGAQKCSSRNLISPHDINESESLSMHEVADLINHALLESVEEYRLTAKIAKLPIEDQSPKYLVVTEYDIYKRLSNLNAAKAGGLDGIPNWILREYAEFLAYPDLIILNAIAATESLKVSRRHSFT